MSAIASAGSSAVAGAAEQGGAGLDRAPRPTASPCTVAVTSRASTRWASRLPGSAACSAMVRGDLVEREEGEQLEVALDVAVVGVEPELVEVVRAGLLGVEPDVAGLALAELGARRRGEEREHQAVRLLARRACPISSMPAVMLPHWSLPPIWSSQPSLRNRCQKSYAWTSM